MRTLVPLVLALLLCAACCEELDGDLRLLLKNGPSQHSGIDGDRSSDLLSERLSDAALGTHEAILKATDKGRIGNAATLGFKLASAATNSATKHGGMQAVEDAANGRRLAATGNYRPDVGAMDTALAASATINKAVNRPSMGSAKFATHVGISEGQVASGTRKHGGFLADLAAEEHPVRHLAAEGNSFRQDAGSTDTFLATSAAITKAVKTPTLGSTKLAAHVGISEGQVATTGSRRHDQFATDLAAEEHPVRRLTQGGGSKGMGGAYHHDAGALDTALATSATINKAVRTPSLGSAKFATHAGIDVAKVATGNRNHAGLLTDLAAEEHPVRRLAATGNNYRPDVGAMDTAQASVAAISKAVNRPSMGSAKFATHVGISEGQVASGTRKHGSLLTDLAAEEHPVRRMLSNRDESGVGAMNTLNAASAAISKAVKTPNLGGAKYATTVGSRAGQIASRAHTGYDTDVATGDRRLAEHIPRRLMGL